MKKLLLALLLLFPGCMAATTPMGANRGSSGDGDQSAVADSFLSPPSSTETPPLGVPGASPAPPPADAANIATPPNAPTPPTPMMRTLPGGEGPAGDGSQTGDRMYAVNSGPIEPKTDQGAAQGQTCTTHHLRLGPSFSQIVSCVADTPVFSGAEPTISLTFLLEKVQDDGQGPANIWVPETEGSLVRLVYLPPGKEPWEATYIDTLTDATPEDGNVEFSGIPATSGSIYLSVQKDKLVGPLPTGWQTFADKEALEHFQTQNFFGIFIPIGGIKVIPQMTAPVSNFKSVVLPSRTAAPERITIPHR